MKFTSLLVSALAGFSLASPLIERRGSSGASVSTTTNNEVQMTDPTVSNLANGVTNLVGQVNQIAITLSGLTAGTVGVTTSDATKTLTDELSQVNATIASVLSAANALETDASSILLPLGETLVGFVTSQVGSALQTLFDEVTLVQSFTGLLTASLELLLVGTTLNLNGLAGRLSSSGLIVGTMPNVTFTR